MLLPEPFRFITTFIITFLEAGLFLNLHTMTLKVRRVRRADNLTAICEPIV
jgi:hypothetical protein